ncbi:MAG TPA: hypothetical protein VGD50_05190, partial [Candidatus Baltobacteraceae bacterium]
MSSIRTLAVAFFSFVALLSPAAAQTTEQADALLHDSLSAPEHVSYVGQVQTVRFSTNAAEATLVRVEHKAPSLTRRWYLAPEALYGDYAITRGTESYQFDTKRSRVVLSKNETLENVALSSNDLTMVFENYRPVIDDSETIADRKTTSIVLINKFT